MSTDTLADAELLEQVHRLVVIERLPLRRAGEILSLPHQVVWALVRRHYPKAKRRRHLALKNAEKIVEMRLSGMRAEDIASRIGCSCRSVFRVFQQWSADDLASVSELPIAQVATYRCPRHGLVKLQPCVACMAEGFHSSTGPSATPGAFGAEHD